MTNLKDKTVFITGASAGIGKATAIRFAKEGCRLILVARRVDRLKSLVSKLNCDCYLIGLDIRNRQAVEKEFSLIPNDFKRFDILINNAGLSRDLLKLHEGDPNGWEEMIDTNIKGLLYISRAVIPEMVKQGTGHIINIGSIAGHEVYPRGNVYCATKHAVKALTKGMLLDLVDTNIRVSSIDPGLVETEFSEVRFHGDKKRASATYKGYKPLKGEDIAEAVIWTASRPAHMQIAEMIVLPTAQASSTLTHKKI